MLPVPRNLPTCRTILLNAWMTTPGFTAMVHGATHAGADIATLTRLQELMHTPVVGRGMKWFLRTVAA